MSTEHLLGDVGLVLDAILSQDDNERRGAEAHLKELCLQFPGELLLLLSQIGAQGVGGFQVDHRLLALILLKRMAFETLPGLYLNPKRPVSTSPFDYIKESVCRRIDTVLGAGLQDDMDTRVRKGLGTCVAEWAKGSSARQRPCLTFPPIMLALTTNERPFHRYTPFQLLHLSPTLLIDSVRDPIPADQLAGILVAGLNDPSMDVRIEAMKATYSILNEGLTGREREQVGAGLVYEAFKALPQIPASLQSVALVPLVEIASFYPALVIPSFDMILPYILSLLSPPPDSLPAYPFTSIPPSALDVLEFEEIANPATEIVLAMFELRRAQAMAWQDGRLLREFVGLLLARMMADLGEADDNCEDWINETDLDMERDGYPDFAEECLDRLAIEADAPDLLPIISEHIRALLQLPDWRCRSCSLIALASVAEGAQAELIPKLQEALTFVYPSATDPHPRVRYSFLQCLGRLFTDSDGAIQANWSDQTLSILLELYNDPVARVRAHAGACTSNYFEIAELPQFAAQLGAIIQAILRCLEKGPLYVQEQMLATLSVIAPAAGNGFVPYYHEVMNRLFAVLNASVGPAQHKLIGRAMECATYIGIAVGKEVFALDAVKLSECLVRIQNDVKTADDVRSIHLVEAWANLCRILNKDFEPFLPHVIPPLLRAARYCAPSPPDPAQPLGEDETEWADITPAQTAEMEEKVLAFDNLAVYAHTMQAAFQPYLGETMELALSALRFRLTEDVREAAAFLIPALLQVAKITNAWSDASQPLIQVFQVLINAITRESDFGYLSLLYKSFQDSLHVIGLALPLQLRSRFLQGTSAHLLDLRGRREDRQNQYPYMDEGDLELYVEEQVEEEAALDYMLKALEMLVGVCKGVEGEEELHMLVDKLYQEVARVKSMALQSRGE